jgi:hypothetical protein
MAMFPIVNGTADGAGGGAGGAGGAGGLGVEEVDPGEDCPGLGVVGGILMLKVVTR